MTITFVLLGYLGHLVVLLPRSVNILGVFPIQSLKTLHILNICKFSLSQIMPVKSKLNWDISRKRDPNSVSIFCKSKPVTTEQS